MSDYSIVPPVTDPSPEQSELMGNGLSLDGEPLNLFKTLAHHPRVLDRVTRLGAVFINHPRLDPRMRELVILRTARWHPSSYEFSHHAVIAARLGISHADIEQTLAPKARFEEDAETAAMRVVDLICRREGDRTEVMSVARRRWSDDEVVELVALIAFYRMLADIVRSCGLTLEPGIPDWSRALGLAPEETSG